ncbi:hypothetical protein OXX79_008008 [Metschnikowia pulcherrima]
MMNNEKQAVITNENDETRPFVALDFRKLSLATIISGIFSMVAIGIFSNLDQSLTRKLVLGGAFSVLEKAKSASTLVALATVITRVNVGSYKFAEVVPRNSSGCVRALVIAGILTFMHGSMEFYVPDKIYEWTQHMEEAAAAAAEAAGASASAVPVVVN